MGIRKLGRGLDVLIPQENREEGGGQEVRSIRVEQVRPNPYQPRTGFREGELEELAASIRREGVLQPVLVRRNADGYQLICGERRLRAAKLAELAKVPALVLDVGDRKVEELALVENLHREDLNPVERARGLQNLVRRYGLSQEGLAEALGMKRSTVANSLRILELPERVLEALRKGEVSFGHAKAILALREPEDRVRACKRVASEGLSVRALERLVSGGELGGVETPERKAAPKKDDVRKSALEDEFTRLLGTKVTISSQNGKRGVVRVHFYSAEDFERLREVFKAGSGAA